MRTTAPALFVAVVACASAPLAAIGDSADRTCCVGTATSAQPAERNAALASVVTNTESGTVTPSR
jgi:hypothetical protein